MARKTTTQPKPEPVQEPVAATIPVQEVEVRQKAGRPSLMVPIAAKRQSALAGKQVLLTTTSQRLAEANDLYQAGKGREAEADAITNDVMKSLAGGIVSGTVEPAEVSELLGNQFGFKKKQDGTPSKTPDGKGTGIRMRIVRMVAAERFATANSDDERAAAGAFFDGLEQSDVAPIVNEVQAGGMSVWQAYDRLAELKAKLRTRAEAAFNAKTIANITHRLSQVEAAAEHFANDPNLVAAYAELLAILPIVDQRAAELVASREATA